MFDWIAFLTSYRIPYSDTGPNTSRDNIVTHCPFCGGADQSQHMSVSVLGKGWRCWRDPSHRGQNPARLVGALAGLSWDRANALVGNATFIPDDFMGRITSVLRPSQNDPAPIGLKLPIEFKAFGQYPSERPYVRYLRDRGFSERDIEFFTPDWGVRYCCRGAYRGRIIFLVRHKKQLASWTGRTISKNDEMRYRALSHKPERATRDGYEPALGAISHFLLWFDKLMRADANTIVLCEGPFDALKINVLGQREGVVATCFFTSAPTEQQLFLLYELLPRFKRRVLMLDSKGTLAIGMKITNALGPLGVRPYTLPTTLKDPGEFDNSTFGKFLLAMKAGVMH